MRARRGVQWCGVAVVLSLLGACGSGSSKPSGKQSRATPQSTTSTTRAAVASLPEGLPRYAVVVVQSPAPYFRTDTLLAVDVRTGKQIPLVTPAVPPPGMANRSWAIGLPDVSPDGRSVVFDVGSSDSSAGATYLVPIDGSAPPRPLQPLGQATFSAPRFSPDGQWFAGASPRGKFAVWPVNGGSPVISSVWAPYSADELKWSPDGTRIAMTNHYEREPLRATLTSVLHFNAARRTLTKDTGKDVAGITPWFTPDGVLHTLTDENVRCGPPQDVDASYRWGISVDCSAHVVWWSTATGPERAHEIPVSTQGVVLRVSW